MRTGILSGYLSRMRAASACLFSAETFHTMKTNVSLVYEMEESE